MRVLVTGGAGFIGSHMVRLLLQKDCDVMNIDKLTYAGSLDNLGSMASHRKHDFQKVDVCDQAKIAELIHGFRPDVVLHMAAESHVDRSIDGPQVFIETNIVGTHSMVKASYDYWLSLDAGAKESFRFVHLSTDEVFGALGDTGFFSEGSPYQPNSPYAASKASSDLLVKSYYKTYGFPAIVVNASNNYGSFQYPEKLIPLMVLSALEEKPLPVYGDGQQVRDWLFVEDHVQALWAVLTTARPGQSYCVGGGNEIRNLDLVMLICQILDDLQPRGQNQSYSELISFVRDRPGHDFRYATDCSKIKADLGWVPPTTFKDGLLRTIQWYVEDQNRLLSIPARARQGKANFA